MKKIILLSLALVAGLFLFNNVTKAQSTPTPALLDLEITAVTWRCQYGNDLDLGDHAQQYEAFNMTGEFLNNSGTAEWFCDDTFWKAPWTMDISSNNLVTSIGTVYTIESWLIEVLTTPAKVYLWDQTVFTGANWDLNSWGATIGSTKTVFEKLSPEGTVGKLGVDNVTLRVLVPANQEIWKYQSTITIQVPTM